MRTNVKAKDYRFDEEVQLAGGSGLKAAAQSPEALLRRIVLANLLWEDVAYTDGVSVTEEIKRLSKLVTPEVLANLAIEVRTKQKLRHVPLLLVRELIRHPDAYFDKSEVLYNVIHRADEMAEFISLYWKDGKCPLAKQVKVGLAKAFAKFDAYQLGKYKGNQNQIKLRDVLRLVHPTPVTGEQSALWKQVIEDTLPIPDTWETALSAGADKKETFTRLIETNKLGALAFLRNLRNMVEAKVDESVILKGFKQINPQWVLPVNGIAAARVAPRFTAEIEDLLFRCLTNQAKLPGKTILIVDVSGSMNTTLSDRSEVRRIDIACSLGFLARELCERAVIYATAGSDTTRIHQTQIVPNMRGFGLMEKIKSNGLGGGGIFTRQCLEYIKNQEKTADRIIVLSDSQDCDLVNKVPKPFGTHNYILDISCEKRGVNFEGVWTAEISGWSEKVFDFILAAENLAVSPQN